MKLISLHIENFGCLHGYDLAFRDGLTVLCEANGFGKTTLAEFIRAMFYGFPRAAKTLDKNKRKKYLPWSGGKCGGHLTFEYEGGTYRIERTFGATPRGDSFNLIDLGTNRKSTRFTEEIGIELFQLDAESFERSTYMPQLHDLGSLSTDSIRAKLGDLVEDTNDINNFEKAVTALKNKRSTFVPYRGSGGSVAEARGQVSRLQEELDRAEGKRETLRAVQVAIQDLEQQRKLNDQELAAVREQITGGSQAAAAATVRQQYENLLDQQRRVQEAAVQDVRFAEEMPSGTDFETARKNCEAYLSLTAQLQNTGLSAGEQAQLEDLNAFFAHGVPDEQKLEELARQHREVLRLGTVWESQKLSSDEQRQLETLERYFERGIPKEHAVSEARRDLERAAQLRQENLRLAMTQPAAGPRQSGGKGAIIALILGVLALAAGIGLMVAESFVIGGVLLGIGLLALIGAGYLSMKRMVSRELSGAAAENRARMDANEAEAARLETQVHAFVGRYSPSGDFSEALHEIQSNRAAYVSLRARSEALNESRSAAQREIAAYAQALDAALAPYFGTGCDAEQAILELRMKRSRMLDLRAKMDAARVSGEALRHRAAALQEQLNGFLSPYFEAVAPSQFHSLLSELRRQCDEYKRIRNRQAELESQIGAFRAEHQAELALPVAEELPNLDELKQREKGLSSEISNLTGEILEQKQLASQLRREIDRIPEIRDGLEYWQERKDADLKNSETLDETLEYLQRAKESLSGNYLGTIQRSFADLLGRMMGEEADKIFLTGDLEVQLERQGQARELGYFSAGQTDMVMLCMRFALVDALFSDVKPFVVLDDPFVNLDDRRTAQALALLKELSQDRQIIYLVCNSSRV